MLRYPKTGMGQGSVLYGKSGNASLFNWTFATRGSRSPSNLILWTEMNRALKMLTATAFRPGVAVLAVGPSCKAWSTSRRSSWKFDPTLKLAVWEFPLIIIYDVLIYYLNRYAAFVATFLSFGTPIPVKTTWNILENTFSTPSHAFIANTVVIIDSLSKSSPSRVSSTVCRW